MSIDMFWKIIDRQIAQLEKAKTAEQVCEILSEDRNPYGERISGDGFFAGGGGDQTVLGALIKAGWVIIDTKASYWWTAQAPDGSRVNYCEGDINICPPQQDERKIHDSDVAPAWFDPAFAGERWDED